MNLQWINHVPQSKHNSLSVYKQHHEIPFVQTPRRVLTIYDFLSLQLYLRTALYDILYLV